MADFRPTDEFGFPMHIDEIVKDRVTEYLPTETKQEALEREIAYNARVLYEADRLRDEADRLRDEAEKRSPIYWGQCSHCDFFGRLLKETGAHENCNTEWREWRD